ncbi:MAG: PAC2 family protein [Thaumarchaeota archaeon]|nr:PAC2 family protein [Candidatus Calditenuaceae archaeon]MDW8041860.1 PAC2 family protein [Nitrososphaerota archaeon]
MDRLGFRDSILRTHVVYDQGMEGYRLDGATFIEGLPGIGMVSKVAIAHVLGVVRAKRVCRLYSPEFPTSAFVSDGKIVLNFADIYAVEHPSPTLVMYGTSQPSSSYGQYEFCSRVIECVKEMGAVRVFTIGGLGGRESITPRREVYCSSTNKSALQKYVKLIDGQVYSGQIVGAAGILMNLAGMAGMENMGMLIEVSETTPDYYACRRAVQVLDRLANLGIGEVTVDQVISVSSKTIARLEY